MPAIKGSDTSPSKVALCCVSCWRSSASRSALGFGLEATVRTPSNAPAKKHRQGGRKTRGSDVLDVAERLGIFRVGQVRF